MKPVVCATIGAIFMVSTKYVLDTIESSIVFPSSKLHKKYNYNLDGHLMSINVPDATIKEYFVETSDGENINVIFYHNPNVKSYVIFAHGNAGNISNRLHIIHTLAKYTSVVLFDYRGYGKSSGKPTEYGLYRDIYAVWEFLVNYHKVEPKSITLYGRSLGAAVVAQLGSVLCNDDNKKPHAIIMESGFSNIENITGDMFFKNLSFIMTNKFKVDKYVETIGCKINLLIAHSPDDEIVKYYHKDILIKASNSKNTFFYKLSGTHNNTHIDDDYVRVLNTFFYK